MLTFAKTSRVMKKGKKSEDRSNSEARRPTILTPNGVFQHPGNATCLCTIRSVYIRGQPLVVSFWLARED